MRFSCQFFISFVIIIIAHILQAFTIDIFIMIALVAIAYELVKCLLNNFQANSYDPKQHPYVHCGESLSHKNSGDVGFA